MQKQLLPILLVLLCLLAGYPTSASAISAPKPLESESRPQLTDLVTMQLNNLSLAEKVAQLFILDADMAGKALPTPVGGYILFSRHTPDKDATLSLTRQLRYSSPRLPPFISVDQEGGRVASILGQGGLTGFDAMIAKMDNQASMQDRIKVKTSTLTSTVEQLGGVVENTAAQFGEVFAPDIQAFAQSAQALTEGWIVPFIANNKGLIKTVFGLMAGFFGLKLAALAFAYSASMVTMPFRAMWTGYKKLQAIQSIWGLLKLGEVSRGVAVFRMLGLSAANATKASALVGKMGAPFANVFQQINAGAGSFGKINIGLNLVKQGFLGVARAMLTTPLGLVIGAIAVAGLLITTQAGAVGLRNSLEARYGKQAWYRIKPLLKAPQAHRYSAFVHIDEALQRFTPTKMSDFLSNIENTGK